MVGVWQTRVGSGICQTRPETIYTYRIYIIVLKVRPVIELPPYHDVAWLALPYRCPACEMLDQHAVHG